MACLPYKDLAMAINIVQTALNWHLLFAISKGLHYRCRDFFLFLPLFQCGCHSNEINHGNCLCDIAAGDDVAICSAAAMANHNSIVFMFWWRKTAKTEGEGEGLSSVTCHSFSSLRKSAVSIFVAVSHCLFRWFISNLGFSPFFLRFTPMCACVRVSVFQANVFPHFTFAWISSSGANDWTPKCIASCDNF